MAVTDDPNPSVVADLCDKALAMSEEERDEFLEKLRKHNQRLHQEVILVLGGMTTRIRGGAGNEQGVGRIELTVTGGPHQGETFAWTSTEPFVVGCSRKKSQFTLKRDDDLSREHFRIEPSVRGCSIEHLGQRRTYLNGIPISKALLRDGDVIRASKSVFRVRLEGFVPPPIPPVVPGYEIEDLIGCGGMGVVWRAWRVADGATVAIKTIAIEAGQEERRRLLREMEVHPKLRHPHIVDCLETGEAKDLPYLVLEYVDGPDLGRMVKAKGPLEIPLAVMLVCQVLEGLDYAHQMHFVHRDVKPSNILVAGGPTPVARLADFGLVRAMEESGMSQLSASSMVAGTPPFMSPEQALRLRDAEPAADQYSVAATLYFLLTGKLVYDGLIGSVAWREALHEGKEPVPIESRRSDIPSPLAKVIHRALQKQPDQRFDRAEGLRQHLLPFASGQVVPGTD